MAQTHLALLGSLRIKIDEQQSVFATSPLAALLGYLALHGTQGRRVARSSLASKLWPNLSERRARYALNDTLYRLRKTLSEASWLHADSATIGLVDVSVDVDMFKTAAASHKLADWQRAFDLYRGDLLEDLDTD